MTDIFFLPPPDPGPAPLPVDRITAQDASECEGCGGEIYEDEPAGYIGDDTYPSCRDCCDQAEEGTP